MFVWKLRNVASSRRVLREVDEYVSQAAKLFAERGNIPLDSLFDFVIKYRIKWRMH